MSDVKTLLCDGSRREFLKASACGALGWTVGSLSRAALADQPSRYTSLDSAKYLGEVQTEAVVEGTPVFTEGPAADAQGNVYFSNVAVNRILRFTAKTKELAVFRENSNAANGLLFDLQGRLLACEGGAKEDGRVTRTDLRSGQVTVLMDAYQGKPLGAPNDLTLDRQGRIYFTSRLANADPHAGNVNAVYRIDPDGKTARVLVAPDIDMPNGIVTSPDNQILYLVESDGRAERSRSIRAYDLQADGTVAKGRILINFYPGRSGDGMCIDRDGNLYVAAGLHKTRGTSETLDTQPGIHVISPHGKLLAFAATPEDTITNCTFGGDDLKTLYVTCGKFLLSIRTKIPGKAAYRPGT
jgi:gluconolactonase